MASLQALMQQEDIVYDDQRRQRLQDMVTLAEQQEDWRLNQRMINHIQRENADEMYRNSSRAFGDAIAFSGHPLARRASMGAYGHYPPHPYAHHHLYASGAPSPYGLAPPPAPGSLPPLDGYGYGSLPPLAPPPPPPPAPAPYNWAAAASLGAMGPGGIEAAASARAANHAVQAHMQSCPLSRPAY